MARLSINNNAPERGMKIAIRIYFGRLLMNNNAPERGMKRLLHRLREEKFRVTEFVVVRSTELISQEEVDHLNRMAGEMGLVRVRCGEEWMCF